MENELKIEHLAPYLPYGLKFSLSRSRDEFICTGLTVEDDGIMAHNIKGYCNVSLGSYYKPILRPISEMPEYHLIELFLLAYNEVYRGIGLLTDDIVYLDFWGGDGDKVGLTAKQDNYIFGFSIDMEDEYDIKFSYRLEHWGDVPNHYLRLNKLTMFGHLFRLYYDMFKLIPAGLAIDINTLNDPK